MELLVKMETPSLALDPPSLDAIIRPGQSFGQPAKSAPDLFRKEACLTPSLLRTYMHKVLCVFWGTGWSTRSFRDAVTLLPDTQTRTGETLPQTWPQPVLGL